MGRGGSASSLEEAGDSVHRHLDGNHNQKHAHQPLHRDQSALSEDSIEEC